MTSNVRFGFSLTPAIGSLESHLQLVRAAEESGLTLVGVQDHPEFPGFLDTLSLIGILLARTERLSFFTDVANTPLRLPAMLAKTAATLDLLSDGRFELGLGAGGYLDAIAALGGPELTPSESVSALEQAIFVIRAMWSGNREVSIAGSHHTLRNVDSGPAPAHPIGIWIGAQSPRMFALTGRLADGWAAPLPAYVPYEKWAPAQDAIDDAAIRAGRDPGSITRIGQVAGSITDAPGEEWEPVGAAPIRGTAEQWAEVIDRLIRELRFDTIIFWPESPTVEQVERFARDVVPRIRPRPT
jgi:alkanesulfonate monooxygenase SsuD/methylene tetrahydromethanopterin reductase-like flavin-dependent oxidoreductase (luciferase family)